MVRGIRRAAQHGRHRAEGLNGVQGPDGWQREIALAGGSNFRDLGGYRTAGGQTVRRGRIYRSANLAGLTPEDHAVVAALALRNVCDFRGDEECASAPTPLDAIATPVLHRLTIHPRIGASLRDLVNTGRATNTSARDIMLQVYRAYAIDHAGVYRRLFALLLDESNYPLLFHCSAGKDRTGFGAALILRLLGVPEADVLEDYLLTNRLYRGVSHLSDLPDDMRLVVSAVHADYLAEAFAAIDSQFGSIDRYAEAALGLGRDERHRLQRLLLD
jgi:protein-tyrosine phosphatase